MVAIGVEQGWVDFVCKGPGKDLLQASQSAGNYPGLLCTAEVATGDVQIHEHRRASVKRYLRTLDFEFHVISTCPK